MDSLPTNIKLRSYGLKENAVNAFKNKALEILTKAKQDRPLLEVELDLKPILEKKVIITHPLGPRTIYDMEADVYIKSVEQILINEHTRVQYINKKFIFSERNYHPIYTIGSHNPIEYLRSANTYVEMVVYQNDLRKSITLSQLHYNDSSIYKCTQVSFEYDKCK